MWLYLDIFLSRFTLRIYMLLGQAAAMHWAALGSMARKWHYAHCAGAARRHTYTAYKGCGFDVE